MGGGEGNPVNGVDNRITRADIEILAEAEKNHQAALRGLLEFDRDGPDAAIRAAEAIESYEVLKRIRDRLLGVHLADLCELALGFLARRGADDEKSSPVVS
jgi:hypothetical protein